MIVQALVRLSSICSDYGRVGHHPGVTSIGALTLKCICHQSNSGDRDRVDWLDHQGWQIDSPAVTSSRNQYIA
jgi:hypothetical protein